MYQLFAIKVIVSHRESVVAHLGLIHQVSH